MLRICLLRSEKIVHRFFYSAFSYLEHPVDRRGLVREQGRDESISISKEKTFDLTNKT